MYNRLSWRALSLVVGLFVTFPAKADSRVPDDQLGAKSQICVVRKFGGTYGLPTTSLYFDDVEVTMLDEAQYYCIVTEPGEHVVATTGVRVQKASVNVKAGSTTYLKLKWKGLVGFVSYPIRVVSESTGIKKLDMCLPAAGSR